MAARILSTPGAIKLQLINLTAQTFSVDIVSWWAGTGDWALNFLSRTRNSRIIVGAAYTDRFKAVSMAHTVKPFKGQVRFLEGCHVKLYIFRKKLKHTTAIVGSMNLGNGLTHEMAVELTGKPVIACKDLFNQLWDRAEPVNAEELKGIASNLSSSYFEQTGN